MSRFCTSLFPQSLCPNYCCDDDTEEDEGEILVYMNDHEANAPFHYPHNFIRTSKFSIISFLPLSLFFQFKKVSNIYFLMNMIIALIPGISPVSPVTAVLPLVFVVFVAITKEGVEDIKRHIRDNRANTQLTTVLRDGKLVKIESRCIHAGDVILAHKDDELWADMIILSCSGPEGQCFIDTCNLDGETNLKSRKALEATWPLDSVETIQRANVVLHTTPPSPELHNWTGFLTVDGVDHPVCIDQFLYRGCVLRNTEWVFGMVAFAGVDTKIFRNLREKPMKSSDLDSKLNWLIIWVFALQNVILFVICSMRCWWQSKHANDWYLRHYMTTKSIIKVWGSHYLTYFILLSYLIPISLFVTIELCKVVQALWIRFDAHMMEFFHGRWHCCIPNTSNLNEQLGVVKLIFTDKTGTLTENIMQFKLADVLGLAVTNDDLEPTRAILRNTSHPQHKAVYKFTLGLTLCNTIYPFHSDGAPNKIHYEGNSPDEVSLVDTAAKLGFRMVERSAKMIKIRINDTHDKQFNILATLPFSANRKMMSIVVEDADTGVIELYNKGADTFVKHRLVQTLQMRELMRDTDSALMDMSTMGLRTLLLTSREVEREQFDAWNVNFAAASKSLVDRDDAIDAVCLELEKDLRLIGSTGIEDKLQEEVPETLSYFLNASVVIWMLTGDKRETAVTIAATSTLFDPRVDFVDHIDVSNLDPASPEAVEKVGRDLATIKQHLEDCEAEMQARANDDSANAIEDVLPRCTFVIDGVALNVAMQHHFQLFLDLSIRVSSAVCCRLTPLQKAMVVRMFQKSSGLTALAIGDGANDVSMIQEGRVGVGIMGLEGAQAALVADYAIPRFRHLRRLCAVHGRYSLLRNSSCIACSFYKNFILSFVQIIFAFYCGFSGLTLIDGWLLTVYNIFLTSIPPFALGIFEKDLPEQTLVERPHMYPPLAKGLYFNVSVGSRWFVESVLHAVMVFYIMYPTAINMDGRSNNYTGSMVGTLTFCGIVCVVLARFGMLIKYWQIFVAAGIVLSLILFLLSIVVYSMIPLVGTSTALYWQIQNIFSESKSWLHLIAWVGFVIVTDMTIYYFHRALSPTAINVVQKQFYRRYYIMRKSL